MSGIIKEKNTKNDKIKIKDILSNVKIDSFFYIILLSTFITSIPSPALGLGSSTIPGGLLCIVLSIQIILGFKQIYLPNFISNFKIKNSFIKKINRYITKVNKIDTPEKKFFNLQILNKISGLMILCNGILMCIPFVFTNWHPSISSSIISLAHIIKNKKLLLLFYFLTLFMFVGYTLFFYLIYKAVKNYSLDKSIMNFVKKKEYRNLFYFLLFFVLCAILFLCMVVFGLLGFFSKKIFVKIFLK